MRRIGKGLAALTLATSGIALAVMGATSPATAGGSDGLVTIHTGDILSGNVVNANIAPVVAAAICGVNVDVIRALSTGDKTDCKNLTRTTGKQHWITKV
ncbi:MAG TPA: hypothetical protein VFT95_21425 [Micromonosporaceae bacterium]|nr:hypothetical protein [Micromonosporaceae bacterium]